MDSVKRRLVYVADESETLFENLTGGTPPTPRPSRLSRIHVTPSSDDEHLQYSIPTPLPVGAAAVAAEAAATASALAVGSDVDPLLLVSYDGHLLADGTGTLHKPRNAAEASRLRVALHVCRTFLREFAKTDMSPDPATPCSSTPPPSTSDDEDESTYEPSRDDEDEESDEEQSPRRRRSKATRANTRAKGGGREGGGNRAGAAEDPTSLTVPELREELRRIGLPVAGNKATLVARLRGHLGESLAATERDLSMTSSPLSASAADGSSLQQKCDNESTSATSQERRVVGEQSAPSRAPQARSSSAAEASTDRPRSPESARTSLGGLWGTLVNVGSLFFRPSTTRTSLPSPTAVPRLGQKGPDERPSAKRARLL